MEYGHGVKLNGLHCVLPWFLLMKTNQIHELPIMEAYLSIAYFKD